LRKPTELKLWSSGTVQCS